MAIFSKKGKAKKSDGKQPAAETDEQKPKPVYRHVPTHAASDSAGQVGRVDNSQQIAMANRRRIANSMFDSTLNNASYAQDIAYNMAHGMPSPNSPAGSQQRLNSMHRNYSEEMFYANRDGRSMPGGSAQRSQSASAARSRASRSSSDYFAQSRAQSTLDSTVVQGKRPVTGSGYGYTNYSSDSGYESAGPASAMHSRAPSEYNLQDNSRNHLSRSSSALLLPELKLDSLPVAGSPPQENEHTKSGDGILKNVGNVSPLDLTSDTRSIKSTKSIASISKRTRFEDDIEPMPSLEQLQAIRTSSSSTPPLADTDDATTQLGWDQHAEFKSEQNHLEPVVPVIPERAAARAISEKYLLQVNTDGVQSREPQPQPPSSKLTAFSDLPKTHSHAEALAQSSKPVPAESPPPLTILEGFKVNKRGKILDEEGDPIGELVEGDLLDCVRQKANGRGEVIDEYGRTVGIVRTVSRLTSPMVSRQDSQLRQSQQPMDIKAVEQPKNSAVLAQDSKEVSVQHALSTAALQEAPSSDAHAAKMIAVQPILSTSPTISAPRLSPRSQARDFAVEMQAIQLPVITATSQDIMKRSMAPRSASERSLSELSKPYARPTMSSVPENNVPDDDLVPETPGAFSYKGDIPSFDGPIPNTHRRSQSPPKSTQSRPTLTGSHPNSAIFAPMKPSTVANTRRATMQYIGGPSAYNGTAARHPAFSALKKNDSNGHDMSSCSSETGTDPSSSDDGRMPMMNGHSRSASLRTTGTASTSKPRTYFTHGGKVVVDSSEVTPKPSMDVKPELPMPPVEETKSEKKKSRMSLGFGRKTKAT